MDSQQPLLSGAANFFFFRSLGYGIIAPDLLGFGGTSKPHDAQDYRTWTVVEDILVILDHENVERTHGIGHDAGTHVLSRLYNYHPKRWATLTFIAVPYTVPGSHFDIEAMKTLMMKFIGFEKLGYAEFLGSEGGPKLVKQHLESFLSIAYHADMNVRADNFYAPGKLEAWLRQDRIDNKIILNAEEKATCLKAFREGDWRAATTGYCLMTQNLNEEREKADLAAGRMTAKLEIPVLAIDSQPDRTSVPGSMSAAFRSHIGEKGHVTFKTVESQGHYPHIVSNEEVSKAIRSIIETVEIKG